MFYRLASIRVDSVGGAGRCNIDATQSKMAKKATSVGVNMYVVLQSALVRGKTGRSRLTSAHDLVGVRGNRSTSPSAGRL